MRNKIIIDLDNTITIDSKSKDYENKPLNNDVARAIDIIKDKYSIEIFTARNMLSFNGDLEMINQITKPIAEKWLFENGVYYDDITFGKPYCGPGGYYVDDKNLTIEEFIFKSTSVYSTKTVDVVVPFYNEEKNVNIVYKDILRLDRLFNIGKFILVNNGSNDNTLKKLNSLTDIDARVQVIDIKKNIGYGFGIKSGLKKSEADFCIINHSDLQFDSFTYFLQNMHQMAKLTKAQSIFSKRINRTWNENLKTFILRIILSFFSKTWIREFNGQPKLIDRDKIEAHIDNLPNDFTLDYVLYRYIKPNIIYPVIQKPRINGNSSWSGLQSASRVFFSYISTAIRNGALSN